MSAADVGRARLLSCPCDASLLALRDALLGRGGGLSSRKVRSITSASTLGLLVVLAVSLGLSPEKVYTSLGLSADGRTPPP